MDTPEKKTKPDIKDWTEKLDRPIYTNRQNALRWRVFGEHLKREIVAAGLSMRAAADLFSVNLKKLHHNRSGIVSPPSIVRLEQWALILDIDRDIFFSWASVVSPDVIEILADHPILCKKIRKYGPDSFLTDSDKRLEGAIRNGNKRKVKDGSY